MLTVSEMDRFTEVGGMINFVSENNKFSVGAPTVANASVVADVVEHFRDEKKVAFKMKRRKGYHRTVGHRQEMTRIKISEIKVK